MKCWPNNIVGGVNERLQVQTNGLTKEHYFVLEVVVVLWIKDLIDNAQCWPLVVRIRFWLS